MRSQRCVSLLFSHSHTHTHARTHTHTQAYRSHPLHFHAQKFQVFSPLIYKKQDISPTKRLTWLIKTNHTQYRHFWISIGILYILDNSGIWVWFWTWLLQIVLNFLLSISTQYAHAIWIQIYICWSLSDQWISDHPALQLPIVVLKSKSTPIAEYFLHRRSKHNLSCLCYPKLWLEPGTCADIFGGQVLKPPKKGTHRQNDFAIDHSWAPRSRSRRNSHNNSNKCPDRYPNTFGGTWQRESNFYS